MDFLGKAKRRRLKGDWVGAQGALLAATSSPGSSEQGRELLVNLFLTCRDLGDFDRAVFLARRSIQIEHRAGASADRLARLNLALAQLLADPENPQADFESAMVLVDLWRPKMGTAAQWIADQLVIHGLSASPIGREFELEARLAEFLEESKSRNLSPYEEAQVSWLEGNARRALDQHEAAVSKLSTARAIFEKEDILLNWGLSSLDLAIALYESGESRVAALEAGRVFRLYRHLDRTDLALSSLQLFIKACAAGAVEHRMFEDARQALSKAFIQQDRQQG